MICLAVLQQLNDLFGCQLLCVLLGNLYHQLQVLLHVGVEQLLQHMSDFSCQIRCSTGIQEEGSWVEA